MDTIKDIIYIYQNSAGDRNQRTFQIKDTKDLNILNNISTAYNKDNINIYPQKYDIGISITIDINFPPNKFRIYEDFKAYIKGNKNDLFNNQNNPPFYIIKENIAYYDKNNKLLNTYISIKKFIRGLVSMSAYNDSPHDKMLFFSKKTLEVSVNLQTTIDDFYKSLEQINKDINLLGTLESFTDWLSDKNTDKHKDEKKAILAFVLIQKTDDNKIPVHNILMDIVAIYESIQTQYSLYLENFNYEKFIKLQEENTAKFVKKINNTISNLLPQFLGLSFLSAIPNILSKEYNTLLYIAIGAYFIMFFLGLLYQKTILKYTKDEVEEYNKKLPKALKNKWVNEYKKIKKLIILQNILFWCLILVGVVYIGYFIIVVFGLDIYNTII